MTSRPQKSIVLRLYVAGDGPNSTEARRNIAAFLADMPERQVRVEIIDVLVHPHRGIADGIIVTPTLVRVGRRPPLRIVGNLRGRSELLAALLAESEEV